MKFIPCSEDVLKIRILKKEVLTRYDCTFDEASINNDNTEILGEIVNYVLDDITNNENFVITCDRIPTHIVCADDAVELICKGIIIKDTTLLDDCETHTEQPNEGSQHLVFRFHNVFEASEFVQRSRVGDIEGIDGILVSYDSQMFLWLVGDDKLVNNIVSLDSIAYTISGMSQTCNNFPLIMEHGDAMYGAIEKLAAI